jgi:hypothetical protein
MREDRKFAGRILESMLLNPISQSVLSGRASQPITSATTASRSRPEPFEYFLPISEIWQAGILLAHLAMLRLKLSSCFPSSQNTELKLATVSSCKFNSQLRLAYAAESVEHKDLLAVASCLRQERLFEFCRLGAGPRMSSRKEHLRG